MKPQPLQIIDSISELTENSIYREIWQRYLHVTDRIQSFEFADLTLKRIKNSIAQAGFFYKEKGIIQCFACEIQIVNWNKRCQPWSLHITESPNCFLILSTYSSPQIELILSKKDHIRSQMTPSDSEQLNITSPPPILSPESQTVQNTNTAPLISCISEKELESYLMDQDIEINELDQYLNQEKPTFCRFDAIVNNFIAKPHKSCCSRYLCHKFNYNSFVERYVYQAWKPRRVLLCKFSFQFLTPNIPFNYLYGIQTWIITLFDVTEQKEYNFIVDETSIVLNLNGLASVLYYVLRTLHLEWSHVIIFNDEPIFNHHLILGSIVLANCRRKNLLVSFECPKLIKRYQQFARFSTIDKMTQLIDRCSLSTPQEYNVAMISVADQSAYFHRIVSKDLCSIMSPTGTNILDIRQIDVQTNEVFVTHDVENFVTSFKPENFSMIRKRKNIQMKVYPTDVVIIMQTKATCINKFSNNTYSDLMGDSICNNKNQDLSKFQTHIMIE